MSPIRVGLVGIGEIARVQHIPTIAADDDFRLTAMASRSRPAVPDGVTLFATQDEMIASGLVDAVALCTPPQVRYGLARSALRAGMHVLMEKPPAQTVAEVDDLARLAGTVGRTLFTTWHSMFSGAGGAPRAGVGGCVFVWGGGGGGGGGSWRGAAPPPCASCGARTCTSSIPAWTGSGSRAAWGCSTRA